jgi:hypothetical protein
MRLWTIQPMEVYHLVMESGIYRCDPYRSDLLKPMEELKREYVRGVRFFTAASGKAGR